MPQNIRVGVRTTTDHYGPVDPSPNTIIVELIIPSRSLGVLQITQIEGVLPTIKLIRWINSGQSGQTSDIIAINNYEFIEERTPPPSEVRPGMIFYVFRTRINQNEFTTALQDGEYYTVDVVSTYLTGHVARDPYRVVTDTIPTYFLKWNASSGTFTSARGVSAAILDYAPAEPNYRSFNPLNVVIPFTGSLPK
jgi:hypothetical protein